MRLFLAFALMAALLGLPATAGAQAQAPRVGVRLFAEVDSNLLSASDSFDAVLGTSRLTAFGAGGDVLNLWKQLFARVAVSRMSKDGNRAFVLDGQPISLGIPIKITMTPIEIGGGWRMPMGSSVEVSPYVGAGVLVQKYEEESSFAGPNDNVSQTDTGYSVFGGVDVNVWRGVIAGVEAQYRGLPDAIGSGGVSQQFEETNLGGFTVRVLFGFKH